MGLLDALKAKDKKGLFTSNDAFASYSTGFLPLDYANGFMYTVKKDDGTKVTLPIFGIIGGTFSTFIGYSGSGKTTLADQIAWSIVRPFPNGLMIHVDIEKTALKPRIMQITGASPEDAERIILAKDNCAIEDVLDMIDGICSAKESLGDECKYELPQYMWKNPKKPQKAYVPTVIILDSIPAFNSRDRKEDELEGQMSTNREVAQISQFYSKCLNRIYKYNICIFSINHIKSKVETNPYQSTPAQTMLLRPGESLPRGQAPIYYAQNIFRTATNKSSMYTLEDNGFSGFRCSLQVTKSKTSFVGTTLNLAFNSEIGFDPVYTLFEFASQAGLIEGRNPFLYIKGLDTFKFSRKNFRQQFIEVETFRNEVIRILTPYMEELMSSNSSENEEQMHIPSDATPTIKLAEN